MPKVSREQGTGAEANLARRIQHERERRKLSYEALAQLVTAAGCKIQGSAIYKIEKATPPRRITVDELTAFADVFDVSVSELLKPLELVQQEIASELLERMQARNRALFQLLTAMLNDFLDLNVVSHEDEDVFDYVLGHIGNQPLGSVDFTTSEKCPLHDATRERVVALTMGAWQAVSGLALARSAT